MFFLLSLVLAPCNSFTAPACTCIQRLDPHTVTQARRALAATDVVFAGRVLHTSYRRHSTRVLTTKGDSTWFRSATLVAAMALEKVWRPDR
jgi:hypothetical protein